MSQPIHMPPHIDAGTANCLWTVVRGLRRYHRYRAVGLDSIPREGPALVVVHHSLVTYDLLLLAASIFEHTGRAPRALADRLIFKTPLLNELARKMGVVMGEPHIGRALLDQGEVVMVAPGGMREALRPSSQRYQISWDRRFGFAKLALETGTSVIPCACPAADDVYCVYDNPLTALAYERLRIPLPVVRGLGPTLLPRPEALTHFVGSPIVPPAYHGNKREVAAFQKQVAGRVEELLQRHD